MQDFLSLQATKALIRMQAQTSALGSRLTLLRTWWIRKWKQQRKNRKKKKGQSQDEENLECKSAGAGRKAQHTSGLERRARDRQP